MGLGRESFLLGAALATASAPFIGHPAAISVAALIGTLVANPDSMRDAGNAWSNNSELEALRNSVTKLQTDLTEVAEWDGAAAETVNTALKKFIDETQGLHEYRNGVGGVLNSSATLYNILSVAVLAIGVVMAKMAVASVASHANPGAWAAVKPALIAGVKSLWVSLKGMRSKLLMFAMGVGGLYMILTMMTSQQGMKFQDMMAGARFQGAELTNDESSGRPMPDFETSAPDLENPQV